MENTVKILIVEDESIVAMELQDRLQRMGYSVISVVDSGDKAIAKAQNIQLDLILMDIIIKGDKDGIETSAIIRQTCNIPIIFLTAHSDPNTLKRAQQEAPYGYILKPFKERELQITIDMALQRFKMERKVYESEAWLKTTLQSIGDGIIATDEKGLILFMNPAATALTGWTEQEAIGREFNTVFNIFYENTGKKQENPVAKVLLTGQIVHLANHTILISKHHRKMCIEDSAAPIKDKQGRIIGVVVVFYDVTKRKEMLRKLKASEEKYRSFIEHFNGITFRLDKAYKPLFIHGAVQEITGYSEQELIKGTPVWNKIIHPEDSKIMMMERKAGLEKTQGKNKEFEFRIVRKDGQSCWVHAFLQKVYDQDENLKYIQGMLYDASDKKLIEAEMIRSQKLESLGVLAGGIAHDFNNLLTAIFGNIGLAKVYMNPQDKAYRRLDEAEKALVRAKDLTQQLLVFSKGGAPILQTIDIRNVIRTSASFALRGSNVKFVFDAAKDLWPVDFDEGQLSQVIQNLIINADHAMPDGGTVSIRCKNIVLKQGNPNIPVGNYVRIVITDEGMGIAPEILNNIFDPYFTTKDHGTGLGLTTIYTIIKNHNAHISVDSVIGKGTSFEILIPASASHQARQIENDEMEFLKGNGKVLIMDDQDIILEFAEMALTEFGYNVDFAHDGAEAIAKYKKAMQDNNPYDLLIMDLTIPGGMGGKEAMIELRKIDPKVRSIVSSGYSGNPVMSEYKKYGFCAVLKKPFKVKEMVATVKATISQACK